MKRYNIPRSTSFADEAIRLPSILENVSITAILKLYRLKRQNFPADSAEKLELLRKKVWPHSNFSFFGVICTTKENLSVSLCVKKFNITRIDPTFREKKISNYQQIKYL